MSKKFIPTQQQRENVEAMIGFGITQDDVCLLIKNSETGKPITKKTLEQYFPAEIETGQTKANAQVGRFIYASITGSPGGITDERARASLAMFWAKMRMGWKDTTVLQHEGKDGGPIIWQSYPEDDTL